MTRNDDLEAALRAMLAEREQDIAVVPTAVLAAARPVSAHEDGAGPGAGTGGTVEPTGRPSTDDLGARRRDRERHRTAWLVAASVLAVLTLVAGILTVRDGSGRDPQPAATSTTGTTPQPTVTPTTPASAHAERQVPLSTFGLAALPGWRRISFQAIGRTSRLALRPDAETGTPPDCNGCGPDQPTAYVSVHAAGDFDPSGLAGRRAVTGAQAGLLSGTYQLDDTGREFATLAWPVPGGRWALAQGTTPLTSSRASLLALVRAARPTAIVQIPLPLRLSRLPAGFPVTDVRVFYDGGTSTTRIELGTPAGATLDIALWRGASFDDLVPAPSKAVRVDGRTGRVDVDRTTFGAAYGAGEVATVSISPIGSPAQARTDLATVLAGLRWTPRGTTVAAEQAIP